VRRLSPPPSRVEEFDSGWRNWISLFRESFLGNQLTRAETVTSSANAGEKSIIYADATSGALTVTLPLVASSEDIVYHIKKIDVSANAVTVDGNGSETIDGATTKSLPNQYDSIIVQCNGSVWYIIG